MGCKRLNNRKFQKPRAKARQNSLSVRMANIRANQASRNRLRELSVSLSRVQLDHHLHDRNELSQPIAREQSQTLGNHSSFKVCRFDVNVGNRHIALRLFYQCWLQVS